MSGWLVSVQKPRTGEVKVVAVSLPDQAAAMQAVQNALTGLSANLSAIKPVDDQLLDLHGVPPGGIKLV